jgi:Fungal specific transcription factor domain
VMWLGLLYTMMCLATQFSYLSERDLRGISEESQSLRETQKFIQRYREKSVQCLILGKYTKCEPYTMETLFLYFTVEYYSKQDTHSANWVLFGIVVRVAMRMGYHRDPSHTPKISPFHGEMRRRIWAIIAQVDIITSSQTGLSRMINPSQCDTKEPQNLLDEDFGESTIELPPPRPNSDCTPMLYMNVRNRIVTIFGMITDMHTVIKSPTYAEVLQLDSLLVQANASIPSLLRPRAMANSITDHSDIIMRRIYLALLVHKAECVLHYRYLIAGRSDSRYVYSRQTCIEGALQILRYQSMLHEETKVDGQLCHVNWKISAFINAEFFHAATVLCVYLDHDIAASVALRYAQDTADGKRKEVIKALQDSYKIWLHARSLSRDAQKAASAVHIVLEKAEKACMVRSTGILEKSQELSGLYSESSSHSESELISVQTIHNLLHRTDSVISSAIG